jgi:hypothetical protein
MIIKIVVYFEFKPLLKIRRNLVKQSKLLNKMTIIIEIKFINKIINIMVQSSVG